MAGCIEVLLRMEILGDLRNIVLDGSPDFLTDSMWFHQITRLDFVVFISFYFCLFQGHIETIFDCQFHPDNPDVLATGSFDGTIKIWDMTALKPVTYTV